MATTSFAVPSQAVDRLLGEEGTDVTLDLLHPGKIEPYEVTITRAGVAREPVVWAMLPDNVVWIRVNAFNEGAGAGVVEAFEEDKRPGARGVILDLRGNPGGLITEEIEIVSQFLPTGAIIFQSQDVDGNIRKHLVEDRQGAWREGPLVVLI